MFSHLAAEYKTKKQKSLILWLFSVYLTSTRVFLDFFPEKTSDNQLIPFFTDVAPPGGRKPASVTNRRPRQSRSLSWSISNSNSRRSLSWELRKSKRGSKLSKPERSWCDTRPDNRLAFVGKFNLFSLLFLFVFVILLFLSGLFFDVTTRSRSRCHVTTLACRYTRKSVCMWVDLVGSGEEKSCVTTTLH